MAFPLFFTLGKFSHPNRQWRHLRYKTLTEIVIPGLLRHAFRHSESSILATAMKSSDWLRGAIDTATYVSSLLSEGAVSVRNTVSPSLVTLRVLSASTIKTIWETKTLTAGIVLGLIIIFIVNYVRSPWRKLPPSPPRLPVLGNALQLRDKSWLLLKDCKERFGEFTDSIHRDMLRRVYGNCRRGYVP